MNRPVSIGLLPIYSIDPSQHNDTSVRSSVRTTEGLDSHGSGSSQTPECIPGRSEHLSVPRGVEDKCGDMPLRSTNPWAQSMISRNLFVIKMGETDGQRIYGALL